MKCLFFISACILIAAVPSFALEYIVTETSTAPVIDGVLSAGEWDEALNVYMVYPDITQSPQEGAIPPGFDAPDNAADLSADCYLTWDYDNIYVAIRVYDQSLCWIDEQPLYEGTSGDMAQFCLNPFNVEGADVYGNGATIYDFVVDTVDSAGPSYSDRGGLNGVVAMTGTALADGYIIEAAISWSQVGITPHYGQVHGCGFVLIDTDNCESWDVLMADFSNAGAWAMFPTGGYNTMKLISEDGCGMTPFNQTDLNYDCHTDMIDFSIIAKSWLDCTDPANSVCW